MILHQRPVEHGFTKTKVIFFSGLSNPATCALSAVQHAFFASLRVPEEWKVYRNFPYVPGGEEPTHLPAMWLASLRNTQQFLAAGHDSFRTAARKHWNALARSADTIVVFALSCGLELLNACLEDRNTAPRLRVLAFGPVARQRPRFSATLVQGSRDYVSRCFFRNCDVVVPGVGHMDYLQHPTVLKLSHEWLCSSISTLSAQDCICRNGV